jgi:hypothetical protein
MSKHPDQLGFDALLADADATNRQRSLEAQSAHLPSDMASAVAYHREQIKRHHAAMLAGDFENAIAIREEAHALALKLNGFEPGILAGEDAPGCQLARSCAAQAGTLPLWGQDGCFVLCIAGMETDVIMHGMFGIGARWSVSPGFEVRAVDQAKPFLSETGYRSFLGLSMPPKTGESVPDYVRRAVEQYIKRELGGKLMPISNLGR